MKGRVALNDLSVVLTLFKVDLFGPIIERSDGQPRTHSPGTRIPAFPWSHTDTTRSRGCFVRPPQEPEGPPIDGRDPAPRQGARRATRRATLREGPEPGASRPG